MTTSGFLPNNLVVCSITSGKVEQSYLTDEQEFYQVLNYKDDVNLEKKN